MLIDATRSLIVRSFSTRGETRFDDANEAGGSLRRGAEQTLRLVERVLAFSRDRASLLWSQRRRDPNFWRARWIKRAMIAIAVVAFCLYVGVVALMYFTQRSLMYFPETIH